MSITQVSTPPTERKTMGVSSSKPEKPKVKPTKRPTNRPLKLRKSVALRQRISLNRATLDHILKQRGHPGRGQTRASIQSGLEQTLRILPPHTFIRTPQGRETNSHEQDEVESRQQVDKDKPLPPWPVLVPATILEEPLMPLWPPLVTARRLEEQLEKSYIQRHREETLRLLECGPDPHQAPRSRLPSIIQRRIRRAAVMKDSSGMGTTRG